VDFDKQPMIDIWRANKEHCTASAVISDGEVVSGSMPSDDYKLCWLDADSWLLATKHVTSASKIKEPNKWLSSNSPMHPLLRS
jgi:hypothetical protein